MSHSTRDLFSLLLSRIIEPGVKKGWVFTSLGVSALRLTCSISESHDTECEGLFHFLFKCLLQFKYFRWDCLLIFTVSYMESFWRLSSVLSTMYFPFLCIESWVQGVIFFILSISLSRSLLTLWFFLRVRVFGWQLRSLSTDLIYTLFLLQFVCCTRWRANSSISFFSLLALLWDSTQMPLSILCPLLCRQVLSSEIAQCHLITHS